MLRTSEERVCGRVRGGKRKGEITYPREKRRFVEFEEKRGKKTGRGRRKSLTWKKQGKERARDRSMGLSTGDCLMVC